MTLIKLAQRGNIPDDFWVMRGNVILEQISKNCKLNLRSRQWKIDNFTEIEINSYYWTADKTHFAQIG